MIDKKQLRRGLRQAASPTSRCSSAPTRCSGCAPHEVFPGYQTALAPDGPVHEDPGPHRASSTRKLGDYVVWDAKTKAPARHHPRRGRRRRWRRTASIRRSRARFKVKLADGKTVEVRHALDALPDPPRRTTTSTPSPRSRARRKTLIEQLAARHRDASSPVAIHQGEGINHWFHATEMNRAAYLPLMLTGNIGKPRRRLPHLGRQLQGRALPGLAVDRARASRAGWRKTRSQPTLDPNGAGQGRPRPRLHQGRGAGLLEPRRQAR